MHCLPKAIVNKPKVNFCMTYQMDLDNSDVRIVLVFDPTYLFFFKKGFLEHDVHATSTQI